ncbi:MAG TPA: DUF167 family protein [Alphaproteobacteria bacterium]|jgi:uncharacterized protein (TIGR00251 family)|nr:DUF167 family protein [Alphaproteobacteria bacterium]
MIAAADSRAALPFSAAADGVRVAVRLTPRARHSGVVGLAEEAGGGVALKVAVTAAPEGGKANAALIALLAREWRVPKSSISVVRGATDRHKTLLVAGASEPLMQQLEKWWRNQAGSRS